MDEIWMLLFFSLAMLIGCYVSGIIPLVVNLSEDKLQIVSVLGAGLLVGTALAVIIPEGVNALYMFDSSHHEHHLAEESINNKVMEDKKIVKKHGNTVEVHSLIGISLVLGFLFMLLVDQIFGQHKSSDVESNGTKQDKNKITTTLGLVVHAAADGIALGAAATTTRADVEIIVFMAIMLHKAPAAFGLVTFLLHDGLDRVRIRRHLLVFSLAAPVLSIVTYFGLSQKGKEKLSSMNATGIAMLFSAGTFLYVATIHVLPEIAYRPHTSNSSDNSPSVSNSDHKGLRKSELLALVVGTLMPLLLSVTHHH